MSRSRLNVQECRQYCRGFKTERVYISEILSRIVKNCIGLNNRNLPNTGNVPDSGNCTGLARFFAQNCFILV